MFRTSVCWLCPGATLPTFMSVQLVCAGWGSEFMSWPTPSLLTKVTRAPRETTMSFGDTPAEVIVIVVEPAGGGAGRRRVGSRCRRGRRLVRRIAASASDDGERRTDGQGQGGQAGSPNGARHVEYLRKSRLWKPLAAPGEAAGKSRVGGRAADAAGAAEGSLAGSSGRRLFRRFGPSAGPSFPSPAGVRPTGKSPHGGRNGPW